MICIFISTAAYVCESQEGVKENETVFIYIEWFVSLFFTVEYAAKVFCARNIWHFFWDIMNFIDFLAVIPFWIDITFDTKQSNLNTHTHTKKNFFDYFFFF